jgi:hypothetical protein
MISNLWLKATLEKIRNSREDLLVEARKMISQREKTLRIRMILRERKSSTSLTEWVGSIGSKNQAMGIAKMLWRKTWSLGVSRRNMFKRKTCQLLPSILPQELYRLLRILRRLWCVITRLGIPLHH